MNVLSVNSSLYQRTVELMFCSPGVHQGVRRSDGRGERRTDGHDLLPFVHSGKVCLKGNCHVSEICSRESIPFTFSLDCLLKHAFVPQSWVQFTRVPKWRRRGGKVLRAGIQNVAQVSQIPAGAARLHLSLHFQLCAKYSS